MISGEATATILTDDMLTLNSHLADNPPKEILWNSWQYKILKKIENGTYNAEVLWCYNEKYGKVGKSVLHRYITENYHAEKYHKPLRFTGRMLEESTDKDQYLRAIIIQLPHTIDMNCRVHCIDALNDIEDYVKQLSKTKTKHPVIIVFAPRKADKILGLDFDTTFDLLCLREQALPIFSDSLPAEELMHLYTSY